MSLTRGDITFLLFACIFLITAQVPSNKPRSEHWIGHTDLEIPRAALTHQLLVSLELSLYMCVRMCVYLFRLL